MNTRIALVVTLLAGLTGAASIAPAMAENHTPADATEMEAMSAVKLSVAEASTAAEAKFGGKAVEVSLDVVNGTPVYTVSLLADGTEMEASVDAMSGVVTMAPAEVADTETPDDAENGGEKSGENEGQNGENGEEAEAQ